MGCPILNGILGKERRERGGNGEREAMQQKPVSMGGGGVWVWAEDPQHSLAPHRDPPPSPSEAALCSPAIAIKALGAAGRAPLQRQQQSL